MLGAMGQAASLQHMTPGDYLAWERSQPEKHDTLALSNGAAVSVDAVYEGAFELEGD